MERWLFTLIFFLLDFSLFNRNNGRTNIYISGGYYLVYARRDVK